MSKKLLRYPKEMRFIDNRRNVDIIGPTEYEVDGDAVDEYLENGWENVSDVDQLVREHWSVVKKQVESGEYDDNLDEVIKYEEQRDSGKRDSVMKAVEERRDDLNSTDSETEESESE